MSKRTKQTTHTARSSRTAAAAPPAALSIAKALTARGGGWASAALVVATLLAYAQVARHEFVSWDDPQYILNNPHVTGGLTWANAAWAMTAGYASNWHPLTWWSHMLDVQLFGLDAGAHHLVSLGLHVASTLLLFAVLRSATGALAPPLFVAAMFALHPLHVESVAWVSERKDVLSTALGMLTLCAYLRYTRQPRAATYAAVFVCLAVGLTAKPMLVTLPFVLLLLDYWPLGRLTRANWKQPAAEKLPLILLAIASSAITLVAQRRGGAVAAVVALPLADRVRNAVVAYATYLAQTVWPLRLAAVYPYQQNLPVWKVAAAAMLCAAVTTAVVRNARRRPYLLTGWFWYIGTLVPVIGLVQVGSQASADRYTYLPLVGIFIMIAWGAEDATRHRPEWRRPLAAVGAAAVAACACLTAVQAAYWHDSLSLWQHAVATTSDNFIAENGLGEALASRGDSDAALAHFREAVRISPDYPYAQNNLGVELRHRQQPAEAAEHFKTALRHRPDFPEAHNNLGNALLDLARFDEAAAEYRAALGLRPDYAEAHNGLGGALASTGHFEEAAAEFTAVIRLQPASVQGRINLGLALASEGRLDAGAKQLQDALALDPANTLARRVLADITAGRGSGR